MRCDARLSCSSYVFPLCPFVSFACRVERLAQTQAKQLKSPFAVTVCLLRACRAFSFHQCCCCDRLISPRSFLDQQRFGSNSGLRRPTSFGRKAETNLLRLICTCSTCKLQIQIEIEIEIAVRKVSVRDYILLFIKPPDRYWHFRRSTQLGVSLFYCILLYEMDFVYLPYLSIFIISISKLLLILTYLHATLFANLYIYVEIKHRLRNLHFFLPLIFQVFRNQLPITMQLLKHFEIMKLADEEI